MAGDPEGEVPFKACGKRFTLFFGMRAQKAVEQYYDLPFFKAIQKAMPNLQKEDLADPDKVREASANVRFTDVAKMFEFALLKHHRDIEEDEVDDIIDDLGLSRASELFGECLSAALSGEDAGGTENPRQASRKKKTGSRSLVTG